MNKKKKIFLITIIIIIIISIIITFYINKNVLPIIKNYSVAEMKRVATTIINRSVTDYTFENINVDELFIISKNKNDDIVTITLDNRIINIITNKISDVCEDNLRNVEEGKFNEIKKNFNIGEEYFSIPSGVFLGNSLLSNIGPEIPMSFKLIGNVNSEILTDVKEYGINNSLITISLEIKVELMVILPISSEFVMIKNNIPIAIKIIQGKVPEIYGGNLIN